LRYNNTTVCITVTFN